MHKSILLILLVFISCLATAQTKPSATSHQVAKGETLYSISKKYHLTVEQLENANKALGPNFKLKIGQKLVIPKTGTQTADKKSPTKPDASNSKSLKNESPSPKTSEPKASKPKEETSSDPSVHIVAKGETVYAIAKANGLTWRQLKDANHLADDMKLKLGQKLIIPSKNKEAMYKPAGKDQSMPQKAETAAMPGTTTEQGKDYLVSEPPVIKREPAKPKESIPQVKATEPVPTKSEKTSQGDENPFLPKPSAPPAAAKPSSTETIKNENVAPNDYGKVFSQYADAGKKKMVYRGIGTFMQSDNPGNQFLALYNYADMGSILKITNLMSKESIFVKVVGKVPAADTQKDVILKVSAEAATKLKVNEEKFLVEVTGFNVE